MIVLARVVTVLLLLAHGLVHLLYLAPDVREFSLERSWVVPESMRRPLGLGLMAATVAAYALLALAVWGLPVLSPAWPVLAVTAASLSLVLLFAFWDRWLVLGLAIDAAILLAAVTRPPWVERLLGPG